MSEKWPRLDCLGWREMCSALHLYLQVVGKYRLAHTPWLNHSWNATFYVTPSGLASSPIPDGPGIEILFDFHEHAVVGKSGTAARHPLRWGHPRSQSFMPTSPTCLPSSAVRRTSTASRMKWRSLYPLQKTTAKGLTIETPFRVFIRC
jgi:hypothetical protein